MVLQHLIFSAIRHSSSIYTLPLQDQHGVDLIETNFLHPGLISQLVATYIMGVVIKQPLSAARSHFGVLRSTNIDGDVKITKLIGKPAPLCPTTTAQMRLLPIATFTCLFTSLLVHLFVYLLCRRLNRLNFPVSRLTYIFAYPRTGLHVCAASTCLFIYKQIIQIYPFHN